MLLAHEMLRAADTRVLVRLGRPLFRSRQSIGSNAEVITQQIRTAVDSLRDRSLAQEIPGTQLDAEIAALPPGSQLVEDGAFQVFCAPAHLIPSVLEDIGRLREVTYRAVGEGTGRNVDLDRFDDHYLHLFAWDRHERSIVGAYRIGETDRVLAREGVDGLYTRTLFRYDARLMARLSPALELGRSFVRTEYQRNYSALLSLWKGIGQFVVRHPQYRVLFGTVSVSARYTSHTHQLLMRFLSQNHRDADLADLAVALNPPRMEPPDPSALAPASIDEVNRLVSAGEPDGKGVPVLLRQYLKLRARVLGFTVDPQFGDALDALMMVDLTKVDPRILKQYLGREGAATFLAAHGHHTAVAA
jgi:putative hemolysin